jgi:hypothetical protein
MGGVRAAARSSPSTTADVGATTAGEDGNGEDMVEDGKGGDRGGRAVSGACGFVSSFLTATAPHVHFSTAVTHNTNTSQPLRALVWK